MRIPDFSKHRLLVAGDVILDRYWSGKTSRISPEAPVPVVNIRSAEQRAGGAANVALGLAALGTPVTLLSRIGQDEAAATLREVLRAGGVQCELESDRSLTTITKLRVISIHQQMIRLDFEDPPTPAAAVRLDAFQAQLSGVDAVILSDYGKGALQNVQDLIQAARAAGKPVLVDPKQVDLGVYRHASVITPNRAEFERAVGVCRNEEELIAKGRELLEAMGWEALVITRSEEGMTLLERHRPPVHVPAQAHEVYDVTGAGDTVIAVLAAARAAGESWASAVAMANLAAGIAVGKLGTATVSLQELCDAAEAPHRAVSRQGIVNEAQLLQQVQEARRRGERVVMTNGCFDILHPGHVSYLAEARQLGDRLVVAVNDDASVRRLKGPSRPIVPAEDRMAVLAGLRSVDWVVPFSEDTPERLIDAVGPDVLVKGGDYQVEQIAGHRGVLARGGEVRILPFVEGRSTSGIVQRIQESSR
ncbi:bifunctional D-glycero-beta-D-manno-heptose-7-phosphate kinase/D-glycero-beta-D-manno-heptose 1-phosphate adenylyltransferase HldE [Aquabacterium sp. A7-Y]|uniref:bifunctional D-glycero-beta-D-manno-heptose-7-phosphate kinase/D-glycero-beta-D-manno-heptose 1-phosphate adenylyltransferase HldE n=1 Tax=Aquabacterium sp. A7-Y TaxID=1349605 RepID=UPI00223D0F0B|nr:bifunctional D-glycero-beta-D-manno-heptose-7-phosphate kinase/D-glycero-beta-D-manno-heptose 1-phosphate adenylyltransferase HldE [Aquabacterium sp. A7-Y]MCW7536295.1 bifunctional D-glycero-beta-D-manno-heptose-7-phosphate kinase/D-glycero-beta-D-manno-heptose 1-phosphate adenylyltransferase HldE [Aquabacterium sp. A7-Y]